MSRYAALGVALAALVAAAPAAAQDRVDPPGQVYVGAVAGYHDLGVDAPGDDGGAIFGGVIGYDYTTTSNVVLGVEGNFQLGTDAIDNEYGVAARVGYRFPSGGKAYLRAGYQWGDIDVNKFAGVNLGGFPVEDTADDYLVGVGGEFPMGERVKLRIGVDTVSFDSVRPTAGLIFGF